ncbi:MAG: hypothetical protein KF691_03425 [Phycisphaeraceae bacterium]|nr:hypothetical protein [Phycisphaeraceae bacterium]
MTRGADPVIWEGDVDLMVDVGPDGSAKPEPVPGSREPLLKVYRVNVSGLGTLDPTTQGFVYQVADVSAIDSHFYLGVQGTAVNTPTATDQSFRCSIGFTVAEELELRKKRLIIAMKLMEIADMNGLEYWRRFSALITYQRGLRAGAKAFMGAGIAATFISPVLGAALTGGGLFVDTTTDYITANFDPELYTALRDAVKNEIMEAKNKLIEDLNTMSYDQYPATRVIAAITDYANHYTIRGAVDALKNSNRLRAETIKNAQAEKKVENR